jgi:hypothetical protein
MPIDGINHIDVKIPHTDKTTTGHTDIVTNPHVDTAPVHTDTTKSHTDAPPHHFDVITTPPGHPQP